MFIILFTAKDIYSWSNYTPLGKVKVVIIGQDPYHGPNQAHGKYMCHPVHKTTNDLSFYPRAVILCAHWCWRSSIFEKCAFLSQYSQNLTIAYYEQSRAIDIRRDQSRIYGVCDPKARVSERGWRGTASPINTSIVSQAFILKRKNRRLAGT